MSYIIQILQRYRHQNMNHGKATANMKNEGKNNNAFN